MRKWLEKFRLKEQIDERQKEEMYRVEHIGCWLAFYGLLAAFLIQGVFLKEPFQMWAPEWVLFMVLACYLLIADLKKGLWSPYKKIPTLKDCLRYSLLGSLPFAAVFTLANYLHYGRPGQSAAAWIWLYVFWFVLLFVVMFLSFIAAGQWLKRREEKLAKMLDEEEEQEKEE